MIDIGFGENDDGSKRYFLPSELFIHDDQIYFGMAARKKFEIVEASQDRLIDSPKQYMTLGTEVSDLHQKPLRKEQDPSKSLSQRDALILYLSHLNHLAEKSLQGSGITTNVRRRYAHPGWDDATADANSRAMNRIMAESIALAKCYAVNSTTGCRLGRPKNLVQAARAADAKDLPFELLIDSVMEATAAGAGALMSTDERRRQPYVILDIGAGTTDVAGCVCVNNPADDRVRVAEVTSAAKAIRRAGNNIDSILLNEILENSSFAKGTTEYDQLSQALRKSIRDYKESLFDDKFLVAELTSDELVEIDLEKFLGITAVKDLFDEIRAIVTDARFRLSATTVSCFWSLPAAARNFLSFRILCPIQSRRMVVS